MKTRAREGTEGTPARDAPQAAAIQGHTSGDCLNTHLPLTLRPSVRCPCVPAASYLDGPERLAEASAGVSCREVMGSRRPFVPEDSDREVPWFSPRLVGDASFQLYSSPTAPPTGNPGHALRLDGAPGQAAAGAGHDRRGGTSGARMMRGQELTSNGEARVAVGTQLPGGRENLAPDGEQGRLRFRRVASDRRDRSTLPCSTLLQCWLHPTGMMPKRGDIPPVRLGQRRLLATRTGVWTPRSLRSVWLSETDALRETCSCLTMPGGDLDARGLRLQPLKANPERAPRMPSTMLYEVHGESWILRRKKGTAFEGEGSWLVLGR